MISLYREFARNFNTPPNVAEEIADAVPVAVIDTPPPNVAEEIAGAVPVAVCSSPAAPLPVPAKLSSRARRLLISHRHKCWLVCCLPVVGHT